MAKANNSNMHKAKKEKNDEFYTRLADIEQELNHYKQHFNNKTVICNCDDPFESNFYKFFFMHMKDWNIKRLITTSYGTSKVAGGQMTLEKWIKNQTAAEARCAYVLDIKRDDFPIDDDNAIFNYDNSIAFAKEHAKRLKGDGDFRSDECLKYLDQADIVVTNPPFSLFREYITTLIEHEKKFLVIGNKNSITYKEVFQYIKENKLWLGYSSPSEYTDPNGNSTLKVARLCRWFTNLTHSKRNEEMILSNSYKKHPEMYPKYDNYDAIEVSKVSDIPKDYDGVMGVPITFLDKYCPDQFKVLGITCRNYSPEYVTKYYTKEMYKNYNDLNGSSCILINNVPKKTYGRLLIKHIKTEEEEEE